MAVLPTKGNLLASKRSRELALTGYELMDRKRNILIREIMGLIDIATEIQSQIDEYFSSAYKALMIANMTLGKCDKIALAVPIDDSLSLRFRSVMGVELASVTSDEAPLRIPYGFENTNSALDEAFIKFSKVKHLIRELAEVENAIYRLAYAIKKTQKRANALSNIVIPGLTNTIKNITDVLEEKEREEFVRLKVIKSQKKNKAQREQKATESA
jgi:V/A-type H+-transporting ATPase subunit D